jgi:two-component system CheB/CheR fusion protein
VSHDDESPESGVDGAPGADRGLRRFLEALSTTYNFDFREYKEASLSRRIRTRMAQIHVDGFDAYTDHLAQHPEERVTLFNSILINVTGFFRDPELWRILADDVIPQVVATGPSRTIRLWSAGCSTGEEPYSLAMLLAEHLRERVGDYHIKIYGTDVDEDALATARHGVYRLDQLKDVPGQLVDRYFTREGQLWRFRREFRRWCIFGSHNLAQAPPLSHIDLLVCRNVLIYFRNELQERIISRFHYALREGGYLVLGRSESLMARSRLFTPRHLPWRVFQRSPALARGAQGPLGDPGDSTARPGGRLEDPGATSRAQRALEALPVAVVVVDMADAIVTWNTAAEELFEVPGANAVGRKFRDLDVSYRVEGLRARIEDAKARQAPARMDGVSFTRRNSEMVHVDMVITPISDGSRLLGVTVTALEATELARLKDQMMRVAEQHATAIEELQSTNEELETTNEELQSTNEELETTVEELQAANAELGTLNNELEGRTAELNRLDAHHASLINSLGFGIVVIDRAGSVRSWNQAAERIWGLRAEHAIGREFAGLPIGPAAQRTGAALDQVWASEQPVVVAGVPYVMPGGEARTAQVRVVPMRDGVGGLTGALAMVLSEGVAEDPLRSR